MPPLYLITQFDSAKLFMMPKPNSETRDTLQADLRCYQQQGVDCVVSLLLTEEVNKFGLQAEADECQALGMAFESFPIKDMSVPKLADLQSFNQVLKHKIEQGQSVAIHCHGGRGRAGTVAITLMQELGLEAEQAMKMAQAGRQDPNVPVCDEQIQLVLNYR